MSALRISTPGQPTRLVDLGPSVARVTHARMALKGNRVGGMIVVTSGTPPRPPAPLSDTQREHDNARRRASRARVKGRT